MYISNSVEDIAVVVTSTKEVNVSAVEQLCRKLRIFALAFYVIYA